MSLNVDGHYDSYRLPRTAVDLDHHGRKNITRGQLVTDMGQIPQGRFVQYKMNWMKNQKVLYARTPGLSESIRNGTYGQRGDGMVPLQTRRTNNTHGMYMVPDPLATSHGH